VIELKMIKSNQIEHHEDNEGEENELNTTTQRRKGENVFNFNSLGVGCSPGTFININIQILKAGIRRSVLRSRIIG